MASRVGVGRLALSVALLLALLGSSFVGCAGPTSQTPSVEVPLANAGAVAGTWAGTIRRNPAAEDDWVELTIKDDGSYQVKSFRTIGVLLGRGQLTASGGKLISETPRARATYTLYEADGKRMLRVDGTLENKVPFSGQLSPAK